MILTDSWLMPGRLGTTGVALATAGFQPMEDERGKTDLFGNPMPVTQRGVADHDQCGGAVGHGRARRSQPHCRDS